MTEFRLSLDNSAIVELALRSPGVQELVARKTATAANVLAGEVGGENVASVVAGKARSRGYVRRLGNRALQEEAQDGALSRALRSTEGG